jgi:AraC family transcriptional activator of pobA
MARASASVARNIQVDEVSPALAAREWHVGAEKRPRCHGYLVRNGAAEAWLAERKLVLVGPAVVWLPRNVGVSVRFAAGASGYLLAADEELLEQTFDNHAEGAALAQFVGRVVSLGLEDAGALVDDLAAGFSAIAREVRHPEPGSRSMVIAHLGVLLLRLWRAAGAPPPRPTGTPERSRILERFLELVDLHFSEHWPITRYVQLLGITEDRLHAVCTKETGRAPLVLIHARLIKEARLRLDRSGLSVEKLSARLGFSDPAYFNRFFKRKVGISPGAYRRSAGARRLTETETFAAWP